MNKNNKSIFLGILTTALIVCFVSIFIYVISFLFMENLLFNLSRPAGFLLMIFVTFLMAFIWLIAYWFMDRVQKEPLKMMLYSFFSALFVHFVLITITQKALNVTNVFGNAETSFIREKLITSVLLPMFSISVIFKAYILNLDSFDETVDSLIYGGFVGAGIAVADCLFIFLKMDSLSLQYLLMTVTSRTMLSSSVCAFAGFLLNRLKEKNTILSFVVAMVSLFVIYSIEFFLEQIVDNNLILAQHQLLGLVVPLCVTVLIFVFISGAIYFILSTTKEYDAGQQAQTSESVESVEESASEENTESAVKTKHKVSLLSLFSIIIFVAVFVNLVLIWHSSNKKVLHNSLDNTYSYCLPEGFTEKKVMSFSLHGNAKSNFNGQHYLMQNNSVGNVSTTEVFISLAENPMIEATGELYFSPQKGCRIYSNNKFQGQRRSGRNGRTVQSYILVKNDKAVVVDIVISAGDYQFAENLIRIISQSLTFN